MDTALPEEVASKMKALLTTYNVKEDLKYNIVPFIIEDNLKMFYYRGLKEWDNEKGYLTVEELVERYLLAKSGVKPNTLANYKFVKNLMKKAPFNEKKISRVKTSDAKLFLIKLQQDGRRYSTIKTVRGVLRPAFQMAVDDDVLRKNPFGFELATVLVNDSVTREAITRKQMR